MLEKIFCRFLPKAALEKRQPRELRSCFLESCPPGKGREGGEIEVKCTLRLGDRFSILLLEFLKIPLHSLWWEKKKNNHLLKVNIKLYY